MSPLQILAASTYALEQRRKCPGSLDDMLAEHPCFEDIENFFYLLGFFILLHVFQWVKRKSVKSKY